MLSRSSCLARGSSPLTATGTPGSDRITCDGSSEIQIVDKDTNGNVVATSQSTATCEVQLDPGTFTITLATIAANGRLSSDGRSIDGLILTLIDPATGVRTPQGFFNFDATQLRLLATGKLNSSFAGFVLSPTGAITGTYDAAGSFDTFISLTSADRRTEVTLMLRGRASNRVPRAAIASPNTAECIGGGAEVLLDARPSIDPDGTQIAKYLWYDGATPIGEGIQLATRLALGDHEIHLYAFDAVGFGDASTVISVRDTKPPVVLSVSANPPCLWPVNHKLVRYDLGSTFSVQAIDECSGAQAQVSFLGVRSSQVADGVGDGHTDPDVVVSQSFFCARSERTGNLSDTREYAVDFVVSDEFANSATTTGTILVGHDQRPDRRCELLPDTQFVDDGDPRCVATSSNSPSTSIGPPVSTSCSSIGGIGSRWSTAWLALLFASFLRRSSRRRP